MDRCVIDYEILQQSTLTRRRCADRAWTPILGQHCANAVALYWANEQTALCICWMPMLAHHCRQYWANIGPTLALYTTTLGHAWLPILGQHCTNAVVLYWANGNEQTALGLCWVPMLAHHCCQYWANIGPTLALCTTTLGHAWLPILGQHCDNAVAIYWVNEQTALGLCWVPMLAHHCCQYWANIGPILDQHWPYIQLHWAMLGFPY